MKQVGAISGVNPLDNTKAGGTTKFKGVAYTLDVIGEASNRPSSHNLQKEKAAILGSGLEHLRLVAGARNAPKPPLSNPPLSI